MLIEKVERYPFLRAPQLSFRPSSVDLVSMLLRYGQSGQISLDVVSGRQYPVERRRPCIYCLLRIFMDTCYELPEKPITYA